MGCLFSSNSGASSSQVRQPAHLPSSNMGGKNSKQTHRNSNITNHKMDSSHISLPIYRETNNVDGMI